MADSFKHAWDRRTGKKLPYKVPETHFQIFAGTLSPTPLQKKQDRTTPAPIPTPSVASVIEVVNKQEGK